MSDKEIAIYIEQLMNVEVTPTLPPVPSADLEQYKRTLIERFSNLRIKVTALRVGMDGASKFLNRFVPTIVEQLRRGDNPHYCALAVGAWTRYLFGYDEKHRPITLQDVLADELKLCELAVQTLPVARTILNANEVFGVLSENHQLAESVERVVKLFHEIGQGKHSNDALMQLHTKNKRQEKKETIILAVIVYFLFMQK